MIRKILVLEGDAGCEVMYIFDSENDFMDYFMGYLKDHSLDIKNVHVVDMEEITGYNLTKYTIV